VEKPPGPRNPATGMQPFTLLSGQALDLTLVWPWYGVARRMGRSVWAVIGGRFN